MSYKLIIRPEAEAEMGAAFAWYEERKPGLGHEFLEEVHSVFRQVEENPLLHAEIYHKARRALTRRFPYSVFYLFENENVEVLGVVHAKRDPHLWHRRAP